MNELEKIKDRLSAQDKKERLEAVKFCFNKTDNLNLKELLPHLIDRLADDYWPIRKTAASAICRVQDTAVKYLFDSLKSSNEDIRYWSSWILSRSKSPEVVKKLISNFEDSEEGIAYWSYKTLVNLKDRALMPLVEALKSESEDVRFWSAKALGKIGGIYAVKALVNAINDSSWRVRKSIIEALASSGDIGTIKHIIPFLNDEYWEIRKQAAEAIAQIEKKGKNYFLPYQAYIKAGTDLKTLTLAKEMAEAIISSYEDFEEEGKKEALLELAKLATPNARDFILARLSDDNEEIRKVAITALQNFEESPEIVAALLKRLNNDTVDIMIAAANTLSKICSEETVMHVVELLDETQGELKAELIKAIGRRKFADMIPPLVRALNDSFEYVRYWAATVLGRLGDTGISDYLIELLSDPFVEVKKAAIKSLGLLGDMSATYSLIDMLQDEDISVVQESIIALGLIGDKRAVAPLLTILKEGNKAYLLLCVRALGDIGDREALPELMKLLKSTDDELLIYWILKAVKNMANADVMETILPLLKSENRDILKETLEILGEIVKTGNQDELALEEILKFVHSDSIDIARAAVELLGKVGTNAACETLVELLKHSERQLRFFAVQYLGRNRYKKAFSEIVKRFSDDYWPVRKAASEAIAKFGSEIVEEFLELLNESEDSNTLYWGIRTLGLLRVENGVEFVKKVISEDEDDFFEVGCEALSKMGQKGEQALIEMLDIKKEKQLFHVVKALRHTKNSTIISDLKSIIQSFGYDIRYWAMKALISISSDEFSEIAALYINDSDPWVRKLAGKYSKGGENYE